MNTSNHNPIRLIVPVTDSTLMKVLMLGSSYQTEVRKGGGDGRVFRLPNSVQIDLEGSSEGEIDLLVSGLAMAVMKKGGVLEIARFVRTTELPPTVISGEYLREKLTKKFLLGLPPGAWLVGNCFPAWIAHLSDRTDRQRVWEQASESRAAQRLVSVVWSEQDAKILAAPPAPFFPPTISRTEGFERFQHGSELQGRFVDDEGDA
jgi:hypothetical protein